MKTRAVVTFIGVVQGVGFRPTIFNFARKFAITGEIRNFGSLGVQAILEGEKSNIDAFLEGVRVALPNMAYLETLDVRWEPYSNQFADLQIKPSSQSTGRTIVLPPDIATCDNCLADLRNAQKKRYFQYPFIACAECGPRFSTMEDLPYDRERSTMNDFPLCPPCQGDYFTPEDRRFHAQTFACHTCGPKFSLHANANGSLSFQEEGNIQKTMAKLLLEGNIFAMKGIGGVHLVCRADEDEVLEKLRARKKKRKYKPFAVMVRDLTQASTFSHVDEFATTLLTSFRRPVVLVPKSKPFPLSKEISPGLDTVGILLPYMGFHHILFDAPLPPLVFTSGNISNLPMAVENDAIVQQLGHLADYFVLHNRRIAQRCDDSVVKIVADVPKIIRRSRGYVPEYIPLPFSCDVVNAVAFGPELHSTGAVQKLSRVFPTQHIGNVTNLETYDFLNDAITHLLKLLGMGKNELTTIACDQHPAFHSSHLAREWGKGGSLEIVPVQHHHAHHAAVLADNGVRVDETVVTIAVDGIGFGPNGEAWGGEVLAGTYARVERVGHLVPVPMPGGDLATKIPARMLLGILSKCLSPEELHSVLLARPLEKLFPKGKAEIDVVINQLKHPSSMPQTSSLGRVLDALAVGFGACVRRTYDGEPAMRFEAFANRVSENAEIPKFTIPIETQGNMQVLAIPTLFEWLLNQNAFNGMPATRHRFAFASHISIARGLTCIALNAASRCGARKVSLTGGVALNQIISSEIKQQIRAAGLEFLEHTRVPPGDAGVSSGQCAVASALAIEKR